MGRDLKREGKKQFLFVFSLRREKSDLKSDSEIIRFQQARRFLLEALGLVLLCRAVVCRTHI